MLFASSSPVLKRGKLIAATIFEEASLTGAAMQHNRQYSSLS